MNLIDRDCFLKEQLDLLKRKQFDDSIEWQDIADFRSDHTGILEHRDTSRKGSKILYEYINAGWVNAPSETKLSNSNLYELEKEKYKIQTEKLELYRWQREDARDELLLEKINAAIKELPELETPSLIARNNCKKSFVLCYGDTHYGPEFEIKGLFGEILNSYSPKIFEYRMWKLFAKVREIIEKEGITSLHIYDFGDCIDGLIRVSQLWNLRCGVVDATINYANFISHWLLEFTKIVNVKFQMVIDANHSQLRMLGQPKNTFKNDNMSKVIAAFIKMRLGDNPNFEFITNPTGMIFDNISNYNILGIHGEIKNMERALKDFSKIYNVNINYLIGGHIHHGKNEEIAQDTEVINIPSIIGIDDYGLSLQKTSNAGAKLFCFEEGIGKTIEYSIKL